MQWYIDRLEELKNATPIISVCGDDCAVCPRFLAETEEELHETAVLWHKIGWRDHIVSNSEIKCTGCGCRSTCTFMILPCQKEKGVTECNKCSEYECEKIKQMLVGSDKKEEECKNHCGNEEMFAMLKRAFYEKRKNLRIGNEEK